MKWSLIVVAASVATIAAQQPTFRTGVTMVSTDVIAHDDKGQFVDSLTRDNFTVLED